VKTSQYGSWLRSFAPLERLGFVEVRQRGSPEHSVIQTGAPTTVPVHVGRDILPILLRQICRYMTVSTDDFLTA